MITIGLSPCPNDTFIFYALLENKIKTPFEFKPYFADVEQLNRLAFERKLEVTKMSFHAYLHLQMDYQLLSSGAALGQACGPLFIYKNKMPKEDSLIAVPGEFTTAYLLFKLFYPSYKNIVFMTFDEIENAILDEKVDAGVIIHENRFTYADKGLQKVMDLGEQWETHTQSMIPLGGIFLRENSSLVKEELEKYIRASIEYAQDNLEETLAYCKKYAQEMDETVMLQHIHLYVNKFSLDLGSEGNASIEKLKQLWQKE